MHSVMKRQLEKTQPKPVNNNLANRVPIRNNQAINVFESTNSFEEALKMANTLANSELVPDIYKGNIANCIMALEMSSRMGTSVIAVMQSLNIIKGKTGWDGKFIIASINASGRFKTSLMYDIKKDEQGKIISCTAYAIDKYDNRLEGPEVTKTMVENEGWLKNTKWTNMPDVMYRYRAAAFFGKTYVPELLMGMQSTEEIYDVYSTKDEDNDKVKEITKESNIEPNIETDVVDAVIEDLIILETKEQVEEFIQNMGYEFEYKSHGKRKYCIVKGDPTDDLEQFKNAGFAKSPRNSILIETTNMDEPNF